jgi:hypothetical protein
MPQGDPTDSANDHPNCDPPIDPPILRSTDQQIPSTADEENSSTAQNSTAKLEKDIRKGESWLIGIGAASVIVNIVIAYFYFSQLALMRTATEASTRAANLAADSFEISDGNFERMMIQTIRQTASQIKSARAAKDASDTASGTLAQSIESFRIDERAWVEIEPIKPTFLVGPIMGPDSGATFTCDIYLKNLGKTVASEISVRAADMMSIDGFDNNRDVIRRTQDNIPATIPNGRVPRVLAPNAVAPAPFRLTCQAPQVFGKSGHEGIHYLIGRVDYCDQFRVKHSMRFCSFVVNDRGEIWSCQEGNDEDRNSESVPDPSCTSR